MRPVHLLDLVPLGEVAMTLAPPVFLPDGPLGTRLVYAVESGTITGERLNAVVTSGEDYVTVSPGGIATLDVRFVATTDDDATVLATYRGRFDTAAPGAAIYTAPTFETGDERYRWLTAIQCVGKGILDGSQLTYSVYEVR